MQGAGFNRFLIVLYIYILGLWETHMGNGESPCLIGITVHSNGSSFIHQPGLLGMASRHMVMLILGNFHQFLNYN